MNRALLAGVKAHLEVTGHMIEIGKRPDEVAAEAGNLPYCIVTAPSSTFEDDDVENVDRAGDHLVWLDVWGLTFDSAGLLAQDLDDRMKVPSITVAGHVVTLVKRTFQQGPTKGDQTYPEPSRFRVRMEFRLWTEDATV